MEAPLQLAGPGQEGDPPGTDSTEVDISKQVNLVDLRASCKALLVPHWKHRQAASFEQLPRAVSAMAVEDQKPLRFLILPDFTESNNPL